MTSAISVNARFTTVPTSPTLTPGQTTGAMAGPLSVAFSNGPGGGWVGLFPVGTSGPNGYVDWQWVTGTQTFSAQVNTVTSGTVTFPRAGMGPVPVGTYVYRWVKDGMVIAQSATLTVADIPAVPVLTSLTPASVVAGTGAVTVHVGGSGFTPASVVQVNGTARPTTYVSATELTFGLSALEVGTANTSYSVTVVTPAPGGLGEGTASAHTLGMVAQPAAPTGTRVRPTTVSAGAAR